MPGLREELPGITKVFNTNKEPAVCRLFYVRHIFRLISDRSCRILKVRQKLPFSEALLEGEERSACRYGGEPLLR